MLRVDLTAAGIPYQDDSGRFLDFHSLRVTYISQLVASGASVKVCQELARHSTPSLTIGVYAKASLHDIKGAVANLPSLKPEETDAAVLAATGTDDAALYFDDTDDSTTLRIVGCHKSSEDSTLGENERRSHNPQVRRSSRLPGNHENK